MHFKLNTPNTSNRRRFLRGLSPGQRGELCCSPARLCSSWPPGSSPGFAQWYAVTVLSLIVTLGRLTGLFPFSSVVEIGLYAPDSVLSVLPDPQFPAALKLLSGAVSHRLDSGSS